MIEEVLYLFDNACEIDVIDIPIDRQLMDYCAMNHCGKYSKYWTCPPCNDGYYDNIIARYNKACVLVNRYTLQDSFDWEGMQNALADNNDKINRAIYQLRDRAIAFDCLKAGCCDLCDECTYPDMPCKNPDMAYPTLESVGIDVMKLSKLTNISYRPSNDTLSYYNIIFYNTTS